MAGWITALITVAACVAGCHGSSEAGKYFITAPGVAVPGTSYTLTVQLLDTPSPVDLWAYLQLDSYTSNTLPAVRVNASSFPLAISDGTLKTISIDVPLSFAGLTSGSRCQLHVRGTGGLQLEETHSVTVPAKIATVIAQPDKVTYRLGDTVTIKTFAFHDQDLTPYTGMYEVQLKTDEGYVMAEWQTTPGVQVNTFTFQLDTHTNTGTWTIMTSGTETGSSTYNFKVGQDHDDFQAGLKRTSLEEASFDVTVQLPYKTMNTSMGLVGTFSASYPHAVGVQGVAVVEVIAYSVRNTQTIRFHGNGSFHFPLMQWSHVEVKVTVTEDETGVTASGQSSVEVFERDVKIEFTEQTAAVFKPRLPFTAHVKISNHADESLHVPADSVYSSVHVYGVGHYSRPAPHGSHFGVGAFSGTYPLLSRKMTLPDSGLFSVDLDIPDDVTSVDLLVTFQGVQKKLTLSRAAPSASETYLQMSLLGDVPSVTDKQDGDVRFRVLSSQPLTELTVELVSRGQVVSAIQPALTNKVASTDTYSADISVTLTWAMTPVSEVIVYQVVQSGGTLQEVVTDSMALNVHGLLQNTVEVTTDNQQPEPGQEVVLNVKAAPGSSVGLLVEEDNGATGAQVLTAEKMSSLKAGTIHVPLSSNPSMSTSQRYGLGAFSAAGLFALRGSSSYSQQSVLVHQTAYRDSSGIVATANTIFLATNTTGSDGRASFLVTLPERVTSYTVTGFAFDVNGHVGVVDQPVRLDAMHAVYGELLGAHHVVSGEHVILTAYVHNTRDVDSQVKVTLRPIENVEILTVHQDGSFNSSAADKEQTVTVPAKSSKQVFFVVTSPVGAVPYSTNAILKLVIHSGGSRQVVPYAFTVVPEGVEQTMTTTALIDVNGHVTKTVDDVIPPKQADPATTTSRAAVEEDFVNLLLPSLVEERDVMEEGTGAAALLHLALPAMVAKARPQYAQQLQGPIERGFQRVTSFVKNSIYNPLTEGSGNNVWMDISTMRLLSEMPDDRSQSRSHLMWAILGRHFYGNSFPSNVVAPIVGFGARYDWSPLDTLEAAEGFAALAAAALPSLPPSPSSNIRGILRDIPIRLQSDHSHVSDPLSLSYLALASLAWSVHNTSSHLMERLMFHPNLRGANSDVLFWDTEASDTFKYYGDWLPAKHVASSRDIITAANSLQLLVQTGRAPEAERVARWLFQQRNANGLFKSALDTMEATKALLVYQSNASGHLHFDNSKQLQDPHQLSNFSVSGQGKVVTQVELKYHVKDDVGAASFEVIPVVLDESLHHFKLMICSRWLRENRTSGVTAQDVMVPSGFVATVTGLTSHQGVQSYIRRNETTVTVFFQQMSRDSTCYTIPVDRVHQVAHASPAYIVTRSFDNPENRDIAAYHPRRLMESSACDLCPTCCL